MEKRQRKGRERINSTLPQRAPARPSKVTCHVKESPRLFSVSRSRRHWEDTSTRAVLRKVVTDKRRTCNLFNLSFVQEPEVVPLKNPSLLQETYWIHYCWVTVPLVPTNVLLDHWLSEGTGVERGKQGTASKVWALGSALLLLLWLLRLKISLNCKWS